MDSKQTWEDIFPDAILSVEELLNSGNPKLSDKSKLKIALENNFLNWIDYKNWAVNYYGHPALHELNTENIIELRRQYTKNSEGFVQYGIWNSELIPLQNWDGSLLVLGLEYSEKVAAIPNAVFVFCSAENLALITNKPMKSILVPLDAPAEKPAAAATVAIDKKSTNENHIWQNLSEKHDDFSFIARKKFDAYVVLRVKPDNTTELYRMDEDLEKEELDNKLFMYDLNSENPFQNVFRNHFTETFNINQLNLKILDFKYACISAIKLGSKVVGFLVGFKTTHLSQDDITTLESISEKAV